MKMCRDTERARLIEDALGDVSAHACQHGDQVCEFYAGCGYQRQRRQRPDLWIVPHQLLFRDRPDFIPEPASLAIDESFWGAALHGIDDVRKISLSDLVEVREIVIATGGAIHRDASRTADLLDVSARVFRALALEPEGHPPRHFDCRRGSRTTIYDSLTAWNGFGNAIRMCTQVCRWRWCAKQWRGCKSKQGRREPHPLLEAAPVDNRVRRRALAMALDPEKSASAWI
jgi:hypothetical protein